VFVHTTDGIRPGVLESPVSWQRSGFTPITPRITLPRYVDVGGHTSAEVASLDIQTGDFITVPKKYRRLADSRASGRSMDDRVGDAALVSAVWALGPTLGGGNITFLWSTSEELGLVGAAAAAKRLAAEGRTPRYVFAVDTFVSSDSPLESKRFADATLGDGFVVRAIDNSNIVPRSLVEKVVRIARQDSIASQYGVTGGGNDGAAFLRYGSVDVALGWPLRYSHSPGEVIDTRDLDALGRIVTAIAQSW
ncbi:MAG: M20/M25/M40 family metallo-hydrolase, partial [Pseudomonadota bacterium]